MLLLRIVLVGVILVLVVVVQSKKSMLKRKSEGTSLKREKGRPAEKMLQKRGSTKKDGGDQEKGQYHAVESIKEFMSGKIVQQCEEGFKKIFERSCAS